MSPLPPTPPLPGISAGVFTAGDSARAFEISVGLGVVGRGAFVDVLVAIMLLARFAARAILVVAFALVFVPVNAVATIVVAPDRW